MSGIKLQAPEVLTDDLRELALDVIENGLGTAIAYWVNASLDDGGLDDFKATYKDRRPVALHFEGDEVAGSPVTVGPEQVIEAMVKIANRDIANGYLTKTIRDQLAAGDYCGEHGAGGDAWSDDVIIQVALYSEIRFG